jgi:type IV pilus assembly protein PilC
MAKFKFKAINQKGERYKGVRESTDKFSMYSEFKDEGETLISASEITAKKPHYFIFMSLLKRVPEHEKIIFTKNLGDMVNAGLPLAKSLVVMNKQMKNLYFKNVISSIIDDVKKGMTLSESSSHHSDVFPNLFTSMVRAGEESGNLSGSLKIVGTQMESNYNLKRKIRGAMIYPGIILGLTAVIGVVMLVYVIPSITATFIGLNISLPLSTRILIGTSDFLKNNIFLFLLVSFFIILSIYAFSKSKKGKNLFDFTVLKIPIIGELVKETNLARISRTISSLLSSGVAFSESLRITEEVIENDYFKDLLKESKVKIEKGETISSVFLSHEKLSSAFVGEMMSVGEETGKLPSMLMEVADFYENSVEQKTKDMSTIIEPFLMIIIGVAVGFFAYSVIKPIYSITSSIQ